MSNTKFQFDAIVIGGGFFGATLAVYLKEYFDKIIVLEKDPDLLQRSSYNNQARIHNGYHYPRCFLTARRSHVSFPRFIEEYPECIVDDFEKYYVVGKNHSKVTSNQFEKFMERVGSPLKKAPKDVTNLFNPDLVETVFSAKEICFDARRLKDIVKEQLKTANVPVRLNTKAKKVKKIADEHLEVTCDGLNGEETLTAKYVFNCTYSQINELLDNSNLDKIPLKHELTEMPLVTPPEILKNKGITMMCGPFFSLMPFPDKNMHTLSHVRYTPHHEWWDKPGEPYMNAHDYFAKIPLETNYPHIIRDVERYLPIIKESKFSGESVWEVKTVLPLSEEDDGRPILFKRHPQAPELTCIMGGKIDNIYDIPDELGFLKK